MEDETGELKVYQIELEPCAYRCRFSAQLAYATERNDAGKAHSIRDMVKGL